MTDSAVSVPRPKRRRRWLLALLPLVLLGFGWWWSTRPPPLPVFLQPFESRIIAREHWREDGAGDKYRQIRFYFVEAPLEEVILELADRFGSDQIHPYEFGATYFPNGDRAGEVAFLNSEIFRKKRGTSVTIMGKVSAIGIVDKTISRVWPGWIELRLGKGPDNVHFNHTYLHDASFSQMSIELLLRAHAAKAKAKK